MTNNPFQKNLEDFRFEKSPLSSEVREKFKKAKNLDEIIRIADKLTDVVTYLMEGNNYSTLEEANVFLKQIQDKWNTTRRPELFEHSPEEVAYFLYDLPFQDVNVTMRDVDLSKNIKAIKEAPLYGNWIKFLDYIYSNEVCATAHGNLNRKAVNELKGLLEIEGLMAQHKDWIRNESDWEELSDLRFCAESVGLIRRRKNKWLAMNKCKNLIQNDGQSELFVMLFEAWFNRLDWDSVARTELLKRVDFQRYRYFLLSALLRMSSGGMNYYEFLRVLHDDFLKLKNNERGIDNYFSNAHFTFLFHYPLFKYLERMDILKITYEKKEGGFMADPTQFRITDFGKYFIELVLKGNDIK